MYPVGAIFVPFPLKTGTHLLHPLPPSIVERICGQVAIVGRAVVPQPCPFHDGCPRLSFFQALLLTKMWPETFYLSAGAPAPAVLTQLNFRLFDSGHHGL